MQRLCIKAPSVTVWINTFHRGPLGGSEGEDAETTTWLRTL